MCETGKIGKESFAILCLKLINSIHFAQILYEEKHFLDSLDYLETISVFACIHHIQNKSSLFI